MDTAAVLLILLLSSTTTMAKKQRCCSTSTANSDYYNYSTTSFSFFFSKCLDLPHLDATLFWTLNSTTTSSSTVLSLLFVASPAKPRGWIGWAINPIAPRMLGAQALLAFRRPHDGSLAAATANISTYYPVLFSKISYDVTDLEAVEKVDEDELGIAAKLRLPAGTQTAVNHVWQVGPDVTADGPIQHYFDDDNVDSVGPLNL